MSNLFKRLSLGLGFGLLLCLLPGDEEELLLKLLVGLTWGLLVGLTWGLLGWLRDGVTEGKIRTRSFPNEGIRRSVLNALIGGLSFALLGGLLVGLLGGLWLGPMAWELVEGGLEWDLSFGLLWGLLFGLSFGLIGSLRFGGRACLYHFALRLVLWYNNFAPLHYVRFLDYATARIFLRKVGGGYKFVHGMLQEYFTAMHETSAEQQDCNRNGYRTKPLSRQCITRPLCP